MRALIDETQKEFQGVAREIARSVGILNPSDVENRKSGWPTFADAGLLELRERTDDEAGASGVEIALLAFELGSALVPDPFLASAIIAGDLIGRSGDPHGWFAGLGGGSDVYGVLLSSDLNDLGKADSKDDIVWGGIDGEGYVLALRPSDSGATLVRGRMTGAERLETISPTSTLWRASGIEWEAGGDLTQGDIFRTTALALAGLSADTVGALDQALSGVVDYSQHRVAYGVNIGSFQALQHIAADAYVAIEGARSASLYAAWAVDMLEPEEALLAARTAKAACAHIGRSTAEDVMQIYGGIGQTWEHIAHFFTRRVIFNTTLFGNEEHQLDAIADARLEGK